MNCEFGAGLFTAVGATRAECRVWGPGVGGAMGAGPARPSAGNQPLDVSPGGREELKRGSGPGEYGPWKSGAGSA